jgi:hypothetical protein
VKPKDSPLNKAAQARRNVESAALNEVSGKFKTGAHKNPGQKRARTRGAATNKAIDDFNK